MIYRLILLMVFGFSNLAFAQQSDCKVNMIELSGSYTGGCKRGLAHGQGVAIGIDQYIGQFKKGMPNGKGTYTWANGTYFEGQWENGKREGKGKMVYGDSLVTGYWKDDVYIGLKLTPSYEIIRTISVSRSTIKKSASSVNGVRIRLLQGGSDNSGVGNFSMSYSSGEEYHSGSIYGLQNVIFPVTIRVSYRSWNLMRTNQFNVLFEFTINEPGMWDVSVNN